MSTQEAAIVLCQGRHAQEKICQCIAGTRSAEGELPIRRLCVRSRTMHPQIGAAKFQLMAAANPIERIGDSERKGGRIVGSGSGGTHLPVTRDEEAWLRTIARSGRGLTSKTRKKMLI